MGVSHGVISEALTFVDFLGDQLARTGVMGLLPS